ncbi:MAG: SPASM domain-containing protein [Candidatus Cloacimonetes bacterium]|nr:SPASM domain-containing protein [Candidatus Cloacimonadota bacterium]
MDLDGLNKTKVSIRLNIFNNELSELATFLNQFTEKEKEVIELVIRPIFNTDKFQKTNSNLLEIDKFIAKARSIGFYTLETHKKPGSFYYCEGDGGLNTFHLFPDLTVWKCGSDREFELDNIGYINEKGQITLDFTKVVNYASNNPFKDIECRECKYLPICFGGCPVDYHKTNKRSCYVKNRSVLQILT